MLAGLAKTYTKTINEGAIPNIEDAWTYICKNESYKACLEGIEKYERTIKDLLSGKLPICMEELVQYHKMAKTSALQLFKEKSVGDIG